LALTARVEALTINPTFGAGVTAQAQAAFNFAAAEFQNTYTDPITINITVNAGNSGLGSSLTNFQFVAGNYGGLTAALIADNTAHPSADGNISVGPTGSIDTRPDPTGGSTFAMAFAEAKSLGLRAGNDAATDGIFTYNSLLTYTFDPNNRMVAGAFDFIGVAEHEISEIMGRIPGLGIASVTGSPLFFPYDLFRYTGNDTRGITNTGAGNFFSIDNGVTNLHGYNNATANGGDPQDWDASNPSDPYNAFTGPNQGHAITSYDITALDVIGYDLRQAVTTAEPGTLALLGTSLFGLATLRRRRRT
jgi:hypothetical protein